MRKTAQYANYEQYRKVKSLFMECKREIRNAGIEINDEAHLTLNNSKSALGMCYKKSLIKISSYTLKLPVKEIKQVLVHELLHTNPKAIGHQALWKRLANKMNKEYGYNIQATTEISPILEEMGSNYASIFNPKYMIKCQKCDKVWYQERITQKKKEGIRNRKYRCDKCGCDMFDIIRRD